MGQKITTARFRFSQQELLDALLIAQIPGIVAGDIDEIKLDALDPSFFEVVLSTSQDTVEEL